MRYLVIMKDGHTLCNVTDKELAEKLCKANKGDHIKQIFHYSHNLPNDTKIILEKGLITCVFTDENGTDRISYRGSLARLLYRIQVFFESGCKNDSIGYDDLSLSAQDGIYNAICAMINEEEE